MWSSSDGSSPRARSVVYGLIALAAVVPVACGGSEDDAEAGGGSVDVSLQEWAVVPEADSAPAGEVTFSLENKGAETHEFVVIKTDLDPGALPTADDGSVSEDGEGMEVVDEVEDLASGGTAELTVDLEAGGYALICNIVEEEDDGTFESHYAQGMRIAFTVD